MAEPANKFQILIETIYQNTGVRLTEVDLKALGDTLTKSGQGMQELGEMSFRSTQRIQNAILATAGLQSPLSMIGDRIEYINFVAQRTGLSLEAMWMKFGPGAMLIAALTLTAQEIAKIGDTGKRSLDEAGLSTDSFFRKVDAGMHPLDLMNQKLEKTDDLVKRLGDDWQRALTGSERTAAGLGDRAAELANDRADIIEKRNDVAGSLKERRADLVEKRKSVGSMTGDDLSQAYLEATGKEAPIIRTFSGTARIRSEAEAGYKAQIEEADRQLKQVNQKAKEQLRKNAKEQAEEKRKADEEAAAEHANDLIMADKKRQQEDERKSSEAHFRSLAQDETRSVSERIKALRELARVRKEGLTAGEKELVDVEIEKQIGDLTKKAIKERAPRAEGFVGPQADSFARIGFNIGNSLPMMTDSASKRSADALERIERDGLKLKTQLDTTTRVS